jgi:transcriptional regulator GlxA family with amidase domain
MRRIIMVLVEDVEILDIAGALQVFHEARLRGADYEILHCACRPSLRTDQGLWLSNLEPLPAPRPPAAPGSPWPQDLIVVPGLRMAALADVDPALYAWLRRAYASGALVASICSGAFLLGEAGLLEGRQCTTHWRVTDELQRRFPTARVLTNRLFVTDGRITSSAGIASGIDMALALVERHHGPALTAVIAREMVVYLRRDGSHLQQSIYLDHRSHLHPGVHRVQDWLVAHAGERFTLADLARIATLSPRRLTRVFRQATGISIHEFTTRLRLEHAGALLHDPGLTVEAVAARCGFASARQLRRRWRKSFDGTPSQGRTRDVARDTAHDTEAPTS